MGSIPRLGRTTADALAGAALLFASSACGGAVDSPVLAAAGSPQRAFNLVVVALDTLRPDHLGCYGYERETSPRLDALAEECLVFENAQTVAPWTAPALTSLMTSLYPDVHRLTGSPDPGRLDDGVVTLAEVLAGEGYATAAFTEGGYAKGDFGLDQGFDVYPSQPRDDKNFTGNRRESRLIRTIGRALDWLEERDDDPFFLFFQTYEPHSPLRAPEEFVRLFVPDYDETAEHDLIRAAIERWNSEGEIDARALEVFRRHMYHCEFTDMPIPQDRERLRAVSEELGVSISKGRVVEDPDMLAWVRDLYDAEIRFMDRQLDRLWRALEEGGHADDTVVVVLSDHGEGLGEHGRMGHGSALFEELTQIVMLMRVPGAEPRRVDDMVRMVDVMPTALELLGVDARELPLQGRSLAELIRVGESGDPPPAFAHALRHADRQQHAVRTERWKLIVDDATGETWLYDLESDPDEKIDRDESHLEVTRDLLVLLTEQMQRDADLAARLGAAPEKRGLSAGALEELSALGYLGDDEE